MAIQDAISLEKNMPLEGTVQRVIVDSVELRLGKRVCTGRTPTNMLVHFESSADVGSVNNVKIIKACPFDLIGEAEE